MISIITPVLDHPEFITDYAAATIEAEVVIVDTGSTPANRKAWMNVGKLIDYPAKGHNYGHWCNAGYQHATGDIIIFLNNDIRADGDWLSEVAADVEDGALYGPELLAQVVGGLRIPFLSGWCIAATKATWDRLKVGETDPQICYPPYQLLGPWNTRDYPAAGYWEDNDLCLRAVMRGIELRQTKWPIVHLDGGNGTAKHIPSAYADTKRNEATFRRSVQEAMSHA